MTASIPPSQRMTAAQRQAIESLLKRAEFDPRTITLMHRNAGVPEHFQGRPVSEWLGSLTIAEASRVIVKLEDYVA